MNRMGALLSGAASVFMIVGLLLMAEACNAQDNDFPQDIYGEYEVAELDDEYPDYMTIINSPFSSMPLTVPSDWVNLCSLIDCESISGSPEYDYLREGVVTNTIIPEDKTDPIKFWTVSIYGGGVYNVPQSSLVSAGAPILTNTSLIQNTLADPINTAIGSPIFVARDINYGGVGFNQIFERIYNEKHESPWLSFGRNWTHNYDWTISMPSDYGNYVHPDMVVVGPTMVEKYAWNGTKYIGNRNNEFYLEDHVVEQTNYGMFSNLFFSENVVYEFDTGSDKLDDLLNKRVSKMHRVVLSDKYGTKYYFAMNGAGPNNILMLVGVSDTNGNVVRLDYDRYLQYMHLELVRVRDKCDTEFLGIDTLCFGGSAGTGGGGGTIGGPGLAVDQRENQLMGLRLSKITSESTGWELRFYYADAPIPPITYDEANWVYETGHTFYRDYVNPLGHRITAVEAVVGGQSLEVLAYSWDTIAADTPINKVYRNRDGRQTKYAYVLSGQKYYLASKTDPLSDKGFEHVTYLRDNKPPMIGVGYSEKPVTLVRNGRNQNTYYFKYNVVGNSPLKTETTVTSDGGFYQKDVYVDGVWREKHFILDGKNYKEEYEYNEDYLPVKITDGEGHKTEMQYDELGNLTYLKDGEGYDLDRRYDDRSRMTWERDFNDVDRNFIYDPNGNLHQVQEPLGKNTTFYYYPNGLLREIVAPGNIATQFTYDKNGYPRSQTEPNVTVQEEIGTSNRAGTSTEYVHDNRGRLLSIKDAYQRATTYAWNDRDQLTDIIYPSETTQIIGEHFTYTTDGYIDIATDPSGTITKYHYDEDGNVTEVIEGFNRPLALHTKYKYDTLSNCTEILDPKENKIVFTINEQGLVRQVTNQAGKSIEYKYDGAFRVETKKVAGGPVLTHEYYDNNRLKSIEPNNSTPPLEYKYDGNGNPTEIRDAEGTKTYHYDSLGRLERVDNSSHGKAIAYTYDTLGRRDTMTVDGVGTYEYDFDELDNLTAIRDPKQRQYRVKYDPIGDPETAWYPSGMKTAYQYYQQSRRLQGIKHLTSRNEDVTAHSYTYDESGKKKTMTDALGEHVYLYDDQDRIGEVRHPGSRGFEKYGYSDTGNLESFQKPGVNLTAQHNTANELVSGFGEMYGYDSAGNMTSRTKSGQTTSYNWDAYNRLVKVDTPDKSVSYVYNAFNQRIRRIDQSTNEETVYLFDGLSVIAEYDKDGGLLRSYVPGISVEEADGTVLYYHADANGNVTALTDANQNITSSYQYDAYGLDGMVGNDVNKYRYVGVYGVAADDDTGLVYMWNRWYDPAVKRYLSSDPVGYLESLNNYQYALHNPINFTDTTGMCIDERPLIAAKLINRAMSSTTSAGSIAGAGMLGQMSVGNRLILNSYMLKHPSTAKAAKNFYSVHPNTNHRYLFNPGMASRIGTSASILSWGLTGIQIYDVYHTTGDNWQATADASAVVAKTAGGFVGAKGGAVIGGSIGSFIGGPGVGTAIGAGIGAVGFGAFGSWFTGETIDELNRNYGVKR